MISIMPRSPTVGEPLAVDYARERDAVLRRLRPVAGPGISIDDTPDGQRISADLGALAADSPVPRPWILGKAMRSVGGAEQTVLLVSSCYWMIGRQLYHHEDMTVELPEADDSILYAKLSMSGGDVTGLGTMAVSQWIVDNINGLWDEDIYPLPLYIVNRDGGPILDLRNIGLPLYA